MWGLFDGQISIASAAIGDWTRMAPLRSLRRSLRFDGRGVFRRWRAVVAEPRRFWGSGGDGNGGD